MTIEYILTWKDVWIASSQLVFYESSSLAASVVEYTRRDFGDKSLKALIRPISLSPFTARSWMRAISSLGVFRMCSRRLILISFSVFGVSFTLSRSVEAFLGF